MAKILGINFETKAEKAEKARKKKLQMDELARLEKLANLPEGGLPPEEAQSEDLKEHMSQIREVLVETTTVSGETAEVDVVIRSSEGEEKESMQLVKTTKGWRMD